MDARPAPGGLVSRSVAQLSSSAAIWIKRRCRPTFGTAWPNPRSPDPEAQQQEKPVPQLTALTISIPVLAFIDTYLTATILPLPVWVTFVGWASFFACGGGMAGLVKSVVSNWIGVVIASCSLLVIAAAPGLPFVAAPAGGVGSGAMIVVSGVPFLRYPPAIV